MESRLINDAVLDAMDKGPLLKEEIIKLALSALEKSTDGSLNLEEKIDAAISKMLSRGVLQASNGYYRRNSERPVSIRIERCEEEILKLLTRENLTKEELKERLSKILGTDKTATERDDAKLASYLGQILKKLVTEKAVSFDGGVYSVSPAKTAELKNRAEIIALMADFLALLHSKGGEFFEGYFMTLLAKYLIRCGKTVIESKTTGGSEDGGIDGIAKTVDSLGFRETIMVQTKIRALAEFSLQAQISTLRL